MSDSIRDYMTADPATCEASDSAADAARAMRDGDFGAVIVVEEGDVKGIVTDRDIVVRAVAEGKGPEQVQLREIFTENPATLSPDDSVEAAIEKMKSADIRRLPVVEGSKPAGIVSLGDLATARDGESVLADISAATPNN